MPRGGGKFGVENVFYGHHHTDESKGKMSEGIRRWFAEHPEWSEKQAARNRARKGESRQFNQEGCNNNFFGRKHSEETKVRIGKSVLSLRKPTTPERQLILILNELFPNQYKYVGNGEVWIAGKNPDFINVNGQKKLIEVFGDFWHQGETGEDRIAHFAKYGFRTLIIWEHELSNKDLIVHKVKDFHDSGTVAKVS